jgi:predicted transcriptional regulator of viral defense system
MKNTLLSERDLLLIEDIIVNYGSIVTFDQIFALFQGKKDRQSIRKMVHKLSNNGWLVRIKKGCYSVSSIESRGFLETPPFKIAQILEESSYISFEGALQYHNMFDQMLGTIVSISLKQSKERLVQNIHYRFVKVSERLYFGWNEYNLESYTIKIASKEKAILDFLAFNRNKYTIDLIKETLISHQSEFDCKEMQQMSLRYSFAVQKILGLICDMLTINSTFLYNKLKNNKNIAHMTGIDHKDHFNSKWRVYY